MYNPNITEFSSEGGKARAISLSPQKRSEIASKAAKARWKHECKNSCRCKHCNQDYFVHQADEASRKEVDICSNFSCKEL